MLRFATGNTDDVSTGLTVAAGKTGTIDTNGNDVTFASSLGGAGSLVKIEGEVTADGVKVAVGGVTLASGGNITVTNSGGGVVSFGNTALLSATGSITLPKLVQAVGTITVNAGGTKDLSALSLAGDLGSKAPVSFGAGSYLPPSP